MAKNDMQMMLQMMQQLSEQQGRNIELAKKPVGKIALSPHSFKSYLGRESAGPQMTTPAAQASAPAAPRTGKPVQQKSSGGFMGFLNSIFGGGQPQQQATPQNTTPRFQPAQQSALETTYDSRLPAQAGGRINPLTGKPMGYNPNQSQQFQQDGWDWNGIPGGRPMGMPERPEPPTIDPNTGQAVYDPIQAAAARLGAAQLQGRMDQTGQQTITYSPQMMGVNPASIQRAPVAPWLDAGVENNIPYNPPPAPVFNQPPSASAQAQLIPDAPQTPGLAGFMSMFSQLMQPPQMPPKGARPQTSIKPPVVKPTVKKQTQQEKNMAKTKEDFRNWFSHVTGPGTGR